MIYAKIFALSESLAFAVVHWHAWALFVLTPVCFILSWWLVKKYAPFARGSGIPQVMASIELAAPKKNHLVKYFLSLRIIVVKIIASLVMVIGGGAIGREGPTIQIAGSVFRKINELLPAWWPKISKRNMIMSGAAAGLAAAFNTPLGGIVFAVEELTKTHISYFKTAIFTAVIIAGLTAQGLAGGYLYLGYPKVDDVSFFIFFPVVAVGVIAGLGGSYMSLMMIRILDWKDRFKTNKQHLLYLLACSLVIASIAFFVSERVIGSGKEIMTTTLFTDDKGFPGICHSFEQQVLSYLLPRARRGVYLRRD